MIDMSPSSSKTPALIHVLATGQRSWHRRLFYICPGGVKYLLSCYNRMKPKDLDSLH